jgi:hypothetical protein
MEWTSTGKISAAVVLGPAHAGEDAEVWETTAEDGHRIEAVRAGEGTAQRPYVLNVRAHSPEGPNGRTRWPTLEEVQAAMNHTLPAGTVVAPAPWQSFGRVAEMVPAVGFAGLLVFQVAAMEGTPAATRVKLSGGALIVPPATPGRPHGQA